MKMRLIHRMILVIGALIVLLIGAGLIVAACGLIPNFTLIPETETENFYNWKRIIVIICGAFLVLFGGYTMLFPGKLRYRKKDFIVQKTENGDLLISIKAIESMVQKCVDMHDEIDVKRMRILPGKSGVIVNLRIAMANNISIPLATSSLSKQIKQYVMASSGVEVGNVIVAVDSTGGEVGSGTNPYTVSQEGKPAEKSPEEEEEKQRPHLRVFRREEEPAIVPVAQEPAPAAQESAVREAVAEAAHSAEEAAAQAVEQAEGKAEAVAETLENTAAEAAETAQNTVEEAAETVADAAAQAADKAADALKDF